jgi:type I restriction enzyme S subunit
MTIANTEQISDRQAFCEYELPEGWDILPLGHCIDILDNLRIPVNSEERNTRHGSIPYYGATGRVGWIDDFLFDEELLLLGEDGAPFLEKSKTVAYIIEGKSWVNNHAHVLRAIQGLTTNKFLKHYLNKFDFSDFVTGSTRLKLTQGAMKKIPVIVPPLAEQSRIVAKVEELLARVNSTKTHLAKVSMILKRFRQAVLAAACSGRLTADWREKTLDVEPASEFLRRIQQDRKKPKKPYLNRTSEEGDIYFDIPDSWFFCFFEDICSNKPHAIKAGPFGSSLTKSCYTPSGYKIYGQEQVIRGDANYGDYYIDEKKFLELKSCEVEVRDLLISLVGTIGKVLIIPDKFEKGIINPRLVKVSLHSEISPEYIAKYLGSTLAINMFKRDSHGGTMEILNLKMLKGLPIPLPPVIEQYEIVRRVEEMFKLADAVDKRVKAATARAEKLTQAILAKAFRGELVPTEAEFARREGRPYETASELLSRIKSERESKRVPEKVRRTRN